MTQSLFDRPLGRVPRAAIFLSGSGSNAIKLLEAISGPDKGSWELAALVTDRPQKSAASRIAARFGFEDRLVELDIAEFYRQRGEPRVSLATPFCRRLRETWTNALRAELKPFAPDFGILAGFVPLCNIAADFPCLNVHPGDLTYERNGRRLLVGLHTIPIEMAIEEGLNFMRSSVIVAQPYRGDGADDMDSGPVLGVSRPVEIDFMGKSREELMALLSIRPQQRPPGGYRDLMEKVASHNQDRLKERGDWTVFPPVVKAFAEGRFAKDEKGSLLWRDDSGSWIPVKTVEFGEGRCKPL
jgi:folate-dependent phosphoribosylglycinamide formyltransferase PurN